MALCCVYFRNLSYTEMYVSVAISSAQISAQGAKLRKQMRALAMPDWQARYCLRPLWELKRKDSHICRLIRM